MVTRTKPRPVYVSLNRNRWKEFHTWDHWRFDQQPTCQPGDYFLFRKGRQVLGRATITHLEEALLPPHTTWHLPARLVWKVYWDPATFEDYRAQVPPAEEA